MLQGFYRRDVQIVLDQVSIAEKSADNLNKLQPTRALSVAITHLQTAELWLKDLADKTPESS